MLFYFEKYDLIATMKFKKREVLSDGLSLFISL